jgi:plasmid stabilization system protein ParE
MAYQIKITAPAVSDIYIAYERIREAAPTLAAGWLRDIFQSIFSLQKMPDRCPLAPEAESLGIEVRQLLFEKRTSLYRIIFDIQGGSLVRILRVWHGSRDRIHKEDIV